MEITVTILKTLWNNAIFSGLSDDDTFDYFDIAKTEDPTLSVQPLYFVIWETNPSIEGWYINKIDRRESLELITKDHPHWTFVVDRSVEFERITMLKSIVVDDINKSIHELYLHVLNQVKPRVIAVTGSAGKTTTVAMIEQMLSPWYKCLRIFSKRITPLIIYSTIINRLTPETKFLLLEMGLYRLDHPYKLSLLLEPDFAIILNILGMHIGVNGIESLEEIAESKLKIIKNKSVIILNKDDLHLSVKNTHNLFFFSINEQSSHAFVKAVQKKQIIIQSFNKEVKVEPYVWTRLYINQCSVAIIIGALLNIPIWSIEKNINGFAPKENRLNKSEYNGQLIFFSALITHAAYLDQMSNNFYEDSTLIILKISFGEDDPESILKGLPIAFSKFTRTIILNSSINIGILTGLDLPTNTSITDKQHLFSSIPPISVIFLHYGKYYAEHGNSASQEINDILSKL